MYRFSFFENGFIHEYINAPKNYKKKHYIQNDFLDAKIENKYPLISEADYSKDEIVISSGSREVKTSLYHYNKTDQNIRNIFNLIQVHLEALIENCELVQVKDYWYFKSPKKFVEFVFRKNELILYLDLKNNQKSLFELRDVSNIGHSGSLLIEVRISKEQEIDELIKLIEISYKNVNQKIINIT